MQHPVRWAKTVLLLVVALLLPFCLHAQDSGDPEGARAAFAGMQHVSGEITAIQGARLTVKSAEGDMVQVVTTDNTHIMKGRASSGGGPVKFADLKVGDGVMAAGNLDAPNKTLHAAFVLATDAAEVKRLREDLGKTYIVGKVTAIDLDDARMTIERPDKVLQTIGFDETTSFRRGSRAQFAQSNGAAGGPAGRTPQVTGGENITLADIKVGDSVRATGALKSGVFVPTQFIVLVRRAGAPSEARP
jgi:hypothetical protein